MITALNGILIVALFFGLGVYWADNALIAFAFALAGASYIVNIAREHAAEDVANKIFWLVFIAGTVGYLYAALRLVGWF